jgi:hypothetical protein
MHTEENKTFKNLREAIIHVISNMLSTFILTCCFIALIQWSLWQCNIRQLSEYPTLPLSLALTSAVFLIQMFFRLVKN